MGDLLAFQAFPKIDRYTNETFTITEKIDGTNACINIVDDETMLCQSRNRIITPEVDNAGFARWAYANAEELIALLGPGRHYGEWWGAGIQRNYGVTNKRLSLFNTHRWVDLDANVGDVPIKSVPVMSSNVQIAFLDEHVRDAHTRLINEGSLAAPFMNPEGCMIYLHRLGRYLKAPLDASPKWAAEKGEPLYRQEYPTSGQVAA